MTRRTPPLVARMSDHATTIFGAMSARAATYQAINLGQGFPDTDGPDELKDIARQAITDGLGNQYPPAHGLPDLRLAIVEHQLRFYDLTLDPDTDVVVTTGASEALASALLALLEPDDEVVLFEPWFDIYGAGISLARARRVSVPMTADLRPDLDRLQQVMSARTKVLLINSPHNPTGTVFTGPELQRIADIAIEHDHRRRRRAIIVHIVMNGDRRPEGGVLNQHHEMVVQRRGQ